MFHSIILVLAWIMTINCISDMILRERMNLQVRNDYKIIGDAELSHIHEIMISIHQENIKQIENLLNIISNITDSKYTNYLSFEDIGNMIHNKIASEEVISWLIKNNAEIVDVTQYGEFITTRASISTWQTLFNTTFYMFQSKNKMVSSSSSPIQTIIRAMSYSLPIHIDQHIYTILNMVNFPPIMIPLHQVQYIGVLNQSNSQQYEFYDQYPELIDKTVTPAFIKSIYNIAATGNGFGSQGIYSGNGFGYSKSDLKRFQSFFKVLDISPYFIQQLHQRFTGNMIKNAFCDVLNLSNSTDAIFHDPSHEEKLQNCIDSNLQLQYITAISGDVPTFIWFDPSSHSDLISWIINVSSIVVTPRVLSIIYYSYEYLFTPYELEIFRIEAMKLSLRGITLITASGDDGASGFLFRQQNGIDISKCGSYPMFPASCPYVTTVGGTNLRNKAFSMKRGHRNKEVACSSDSRCKITSGGGFSDIYEAPLYQRKAISLYASKFKADSRMSSHLQKRLNKRGYPDISLLSSDYVIIVNSTAYKISSTAMSTVVFAGMISLINSYRFQYSLKSVGWLNPVLYDHKDKFTNDVLYGSNYCTADHTRCCHIGYNATIGWDPVSGLGSLDYSKFFKLINNYTSYGTDNNNMFSRYDVNSRQNMNMTKYNHKYRLFKYKSNNRGKFRFRDKQKQESSSRFTSKKNLNAKKSSQVKH